VLPHAVTKPPRSSLVEPEAFSDDRTFFHLAPPPDHRGELASADFFDDNPVSTATIPYSSHALSIG